jgi:putative phosphoesterase
MKRIALISDTHGFFDPNILKYIESCDEVWHAGDIGTLSVTEALQEHKPVKAVHGNIDDQEVRKVWPRDQRFFCEKVEVWITHIGGYPGHYAPDVREKLNASPPKLFICGHSHILKVMYDKKHALLHINPGAAGVSGFHKVRTMVRFTIDGNEIKDMEVVELGPRVSSKAEEIQ